MSDGVVVADSHSQQCGCCFSHCRKPSGLCHAGERSVPDRGHGLHSPSFNKDQSGTATPNSEEGAASSGFAGTILNLVDADGGPQEYMALKLERESRAAATKLPLPEDKGTTHKPAEPGDQSHEAQDGHDAAVPTSPVMSQMSMPGAWLLNHRRLPGMLGQMTSDIMGRAQLDQVRLTPL